MRSKFFAVSRLRALYCFAVSPGCKSEGGACCACCASIIDRSNAPTRVFLVIPHLLPTGRHIGTSTNRGLG